MSVSRNYRPLIVDGLMLWIFVLSLWLIKACPLGVVLVFCMFNFRMLLSYFFSLVFFFMHLVLSLPHMQSVSSYPPSAAVPADAPFFPCFFFFLHPLFQSCVLPLLSGSLDMACSTPLIVSQKRKCTIRENEVWGHPE